MAQLTYQITGDLTGLASAADGAKGILNNLQAQADKLNIKLFGAETQKDIESIGGALTIVTGKINEYMTAAIQGSAAFKDQSAQAALDALSTKITVLTGNAELFGESIKNQQAQISAYQQAINKILAQGFGPLDSRIVSLKTNVDRLTSSIEAQKNAAKTYVDPFAKFQTTGALIKDAESKVRNLTTALRDATNTRDIAQYNVRLTEAQKNLEALKNTGVQTAASTSSVASSIKEVENAGSGKGSFFGSLGSAYGYIRQIAYILPGIGIAGIFNLGFEAIGKAVSELDLFNTKINKSVEILKTFNELQKEANSTAGEQIAPLKALYDAATDVSKSMQSRIEAAKELKDLDFETFGNATNLAIVNGKLKTSYDELTDSILAEAKAQAAINIIGKLSADILNAQYKQQKIAIANANEIARAQTIVPKGTINNANSDQLFNNPQQDLIDASNDRAKKSTKDQQDIIDARVAQIKAIESLAQLTTKTSADLAKANKFLGPNLENFAGILNTAIKEGDLKQLERLEADLKIKLDSLAPTDPQIKNLRDKVQQVEDIIKNAYTVKPTKSTADSGISQQQFIDQLGNISRTSSASSGQSGLTGLALDLQQIKDKYTKLYAELQSLDDKRDASSKISNKQRVQDETNSAAVDAQLRINEAKEISDATIKDEQRTAQEIQRIRDEFGVKSTQTRAREIAAINTLADSEIIKAQGNEKKLETIEQGRTTATQAVNDKYQLIISQTYEKINDIVAQGNANQTDTEARKIAKISVQYDKLTQQVNKYYADLKTLQSQGDVSLQGRDLNAEQQNSDAQLQKAKQLQISIVLSATFSKALQGSIDTFANDFYSTIVNLGKTRADIDNKYLADLANATDQSAKDQINKIHDLELAATTSFGAIFSSLVSKFNQTFSQSIVQSFVKKLTDGFGETLISAPLGLGKADPAVSLSNAGVSFSQTVIAAGQAFAASAVGSTIPLTSSITDSGHEFEHATTTGSAEVKTGLSKGAAGLIAAGSVLGSIVSGLGKPTNSTTSALGGALSGAAEGAALGTALGGPVLGTIAGGIIGGIAGLFSASKARKALQEQQLEQAKEQTALLQAANAYTSQIIGRQTSNGIISGISVGSTGQLVATVSGSDLQFVLDRNAKSR